MSIPNLCFTKYGDDWIALTEIQGETYAFTLSSLDYSLRVQYGRANDDTYTNGSIDMSSTTVRATFTGVALAIGVFTMRFLLDTSCCGSSSSSSASASTSSSSASESSSSTSGAGNGTVVCTVCASGFAPAAFWINGTFVTGDCVDGDCEAFYGLVVPFLEETPGVCRWQTATNVDLCDTSGAVYVTLEAGGAVTLVLPASVTYQGTWDCTGTGGVTLSLQATSDTRCVWPETVILEPMW